MVKTSTHFKTHKYKQPHITKPTRTHTHTLNPTPHTHTHINTHTNLHITNPTLQHTHSLLALYPYLELNPTKCISQYRSCNCQRYIDRSRTLLVLCKVLLVNSQAVRCTRIAYLMIRRSHTIHSYCQKAGNLV